MRTSIISIFLAVMAVLSLSCKETPQDPAVTATITANDITVEVGKAATIGAVTNSTAAITYSSADESVATVSPAGEVTGIKAGTTTVTLKVEAVENLFTTAETTINVTVTESAPVDDGKPKPGIYTFTVSPLKGAWEAGDQILVQGGYGPAAQTITLSSSQISSDGKTASVELGGDLFKYLTEPDPLYAVWPATAAKKEDGPTGQVITYDSYDTMLAQAYLNENNFAFKDITAFISFKVSGDYDRFIIAGDQRPGLRYTGVYRNEYSTAKVSPAKPKDDGYPFREAQLTADGSATLWFPGGFNFRGGFTLYFAKGDNWTATYTYAEDANLKAGQKLELGEITSLEAYSGGKPHMPELGNMTAYNVVFNELSGIYLSAGKDFFWGVDDNGAIGQISFTGEVLYKQSIGGETEAVTLDPETGDLLIGEESSPARISRVSGPDYNKRVKLCTIPGTSGFGNSGLEGLTYYKDGLAYAGFQTGAYLFCFNLKNINENGEAEVLWQKNLRELFPSITEVGDLYYDPLTDWLWVVDSETHKFYALTGDAEHMLGSYTLKTRLNEEGIYVDHDRSCVWITDDDEKTSHLYKYEMSNLNDFIIND